MRKLPIFIACLCLVGSSAVFAQDYKHKNQRGTGHEQHQTQRRDNDYNRRTGNRSDRVVITRTSRTDTYQGKNRLFEIRGNRCDVRIRGDARGIIVVGNNNRVTADDVGYIDVRGRNNRVAYNDGLHREDPKIRRSGSNNKIYDRTP